jgi:hypothetical protein
MKIWFDFEFIEDGKTIDPISVGLVREDGATYYAEFEECRIGLACEWVKEHVFPRLSGKWAWKPTSEIARDIVEFAGEAPVFWAHYADYDWVALCQLYGRMTDLPETWPMFCRDTKQFAEFLGDPGLPEQTTPEHHALNDARHTKAIYDFLNEKAAGREPGG